MSCVICGAEPTVKSHIVPRALFHDMKPANGQAIGNLRSGPGYRYLQSGSWDDTILCGEHEAQLHPVDEYGISFCRSFIAGRDEEPRRVDVPNPEPQLLVDFACACIWRMAVSRSGREPEKWLGPYARRLADSLFRDVPCRPLLLVACNAYQLKNGEILNMGALPYRYIEEGIHFWRFVISGLIFDLKLDSRTTPRAMAVLAANAQTSITLFEDFPQSAMRTPGLGRALAALALPRSNGRVRPK